MILDTSALAAILFPEPEAEHFNNLIHDAERCALSIANLIELSIVVESQLGSAASRQCDVYIERAGIVIEPVSIEQGHLARQAYFDFGKGRHPASLNFGDCFAYALAKVSGEPLLF
jgi:ribonuclease VapC